MIRFLAVLAAFCLALAPCRSHAESWNLVLLSTGDSEGQLLPGPGEGDAPVGGYARLAAAIAAMKAEYPDMTLTLSTGEDLIGPFYERYYGEPIFKAMELMGYDAGALANHEFDMGDAFLARALAHCSFPLVESNVAAGKDSPLHNAFKPWIMLEKNGLKIGVFGLMNAALPTISKPGPEVAVNADYAGVSRETVAALRAQGADLVVALAQTGLAQAQALAKEVPDIDVICVGDSDVAVERGRELLRHPDGRITVVTQTGQKGVYLGTLKLRVENRRIANYFWNLAPLTASVPEDPAVRALVAEYVDKLPADEVLARTTAPLDVRKKALRTAEAPMGNFVCDSLRKAFGVDVMLYNGGGIRGDRLLPAGEIKASDIRDMFPFGDTLKVMTMPGKVLYEAFERSAASLPESSGAFLQVSGLRAVLDAGRAPMTLAKDDRGGVTAVATPGARVLGLELCDAAGGCAPLDPNATLKVGASGFLAEGGDGYVMFRDLPKTDSGVKVADAMIKILRGDASFSPVADGRIVIKGP